MRVTRPEFTCPLIVIDDFLPTGDASGLLQEAIDLKPIYMPGSVGNGPDNKVNRDFRRNDVVMLNSVFAADQSRSVILRTLKKRVAEGDLNRVWHEGHLIFDIINYCTWRETVLSRYGRCEFYGRHQDTMRDRDNPGFITRRLVTLVYYMNREPEQFAGGGLRLYEKNKEFRVEPRHNRAVIFPSFVFHEVENVQLPEDAPWDSGRFSLNLWMGFR